MSLLHRAPATTCSQCGHSALGPVQRALEPLVWAQRCCHVLVDDPWSCYGGEECGCAGDLHRRRSSRRWRELSRRG